MSENMTWLRQRTGIGFLFLAGGLVLLAGSIAATVAEPNSDFNFRIIGGLGIAAGGIGVAFLIRYGLATRNPALARQVVVEERDERGVLIRRRAGNRAFWVSALLVFGGLMWSSFAANDQLPALEGDGLWNYLAAAVILPFVVYVGSVVLDERTL